MRLLAFFSAFFAYLTVSVGQVDLTRYERTFQEQAKVYGIWLEHSGMHKQLQVETITVSPDKVKLFLKFASEDPDTVSATWRQLKADFEEVSAFTLEERLYLQMLHTFELEPDQAKLSLYDTYDPNKVYCFSRKVYLDADTLRVDTSACKDVPAEVVVTRADLEDLPKSAKVALFPELDENKNVDVPPITIGEMLPPDKLFDMIMGFAKREYDGQYCDFPNLARTREVLRTRYALQFKVRDLCQVVIKDKEDWMCEWINWLGGDCNWLKREMLTINVKYSLSENGEGILLQCDINGRFGSGYFEEVLEAGYADMERDERFKEMLEDYAQEFESKLKAYLLNPKP